LEVFDRRITRTGNTLVRRTAVFMTAQAQGTPAAVVHNLRHNKVLYERVIILTLQTTRTPRNTDWLMYR
jgi:KUP system potassium uptake protein